MYDCFGTSLSGWELVLVNVAIYGVLLVAPMAITYVATGVSRPLKRQAKILLLSFIILGIGGFLVYQFEVSYLVLVLVVLNGVNAAWAVVQRDRVEASLLQGN